MVATEERLRRVELELAALRQLIETQASLLSALWTGAGPREAGDQA